MDECIKVGELTLVICDDEYATVIDFYKALGDDDEKLTYISSYVVPDIPTTEPPSREVGLTGPEMGMRRRAKLAKLKREEEAQ